MFFLTTSSGSTKIVCPEELTSCTIPLIRVLMFAFTARTWRSARNAGTLLARAGERLESLVYFLSAPAISVWSRAMFARICLKTGRSFNCPSLSKTLEISFLTAESSCRLSVCASESSFFTLKVFEARFIAFSASKAEVANCRTAKIWLCSRVVPSTFRNLKNE